jgi:hypothetical protein
MRERSALPDLDVVTLSHPAGPPSSIRRSTRTTESVVVVVVKVQWHAVIAIAIALLPTTGRERRKIRCLCRYQY